jgi:hypothetical protein
LYIVFATPRKSGRLNRVAGSMVLYVIYNSLNTNCVISARALDTINSAHMSRDGAAWLSN